MEKSVWRVHMDGVGGSCAEEGQLQLCVKFCLLAAAVCKDEMALKMFR